MEADKNGVEVIKDARSLVEVLATAIGSVWQSRGTTSVIRKQTRHYASLQPIPTDSRLLARLELTKGRALVYNAHSQVR